MHVDYTLNDRKMTRNTKHGISQQKMEITQNREKYENDKKEDKKPRNSYEK